MHTFLNHARRQQMFLIATMLFAFICHARAANPSISGQPQFSVTVGELYQFQPARLAAGTYHFAVIAYTTDGLTNDLSEIAWKNM